MTYSRRQGVVQDMWKTNGSEQANEDEPGKRASPQIQYTHGQIKVICIKLQNLPRRMLNTICYEIILHLPNDGTYMIKQRLNYFSQERKQKAYMKHIHICGRYYSRLHKVGLFNVFEIRGYWVSAFVPCAN